MQSHASSMTVFELDPEVCDVAHVHGYSGEHLALAAHRSPRHKNRAHAETCADHVLVHVKYSW